MEEPSILNTIIESKNKIIEENLGKLKNRGE